ncbi:MAG: outer membrane protein assembly factor BamD [Alphaproteobacteria bacterium]|nr:outer membrane protein assembly factor BamD [Alphaproteobacteria bacterium]MDX5369052.1 outer membrane protein assembly factor BamD [Alphaproteobacteria bacterium]MDX5463756.1 outer membrane protein assembly factor BamD [Alphaproteobacteria bacterium]
MFQRLSRLTIAVLMLAGVSACGSTSQEEVPYVERPVEDLYNSAMNALNAQEYEIAVQLFDEVERQHPYSVWARRAILMGAFAAYQDNDYTASIAGAERYLELYPGSEDAAYAHYLIAQSYYEQISDVRRDQGFTQLALRNLREVVQRYPDTDYARDARVKIDLTLDHLAGKEMAIGRYYLEQRKYIGAINRFRKVVEDYQTTSHVPEALHRLVEANLAMGLASEAQTAAAVLGYNYPGSPWYADSYYLLEGKDLRPEVDEGSWLSRLMRSLRNAI